VLDAIGIARRSDDKLHLKARLRGSELTDALSDRQLNGLWMHTFTPLERWTLFWKAPVVLYLVNVILVFSPPHHHHPVPVCGRVLLHCTDCAAIAA
jgi:hypothetical protein